MKKLRSFALALISLTTVFIFLSIFTVYLAVSDELLVVGTKKSNPQSLLSLKQGVKQAIEELNSGNRQKTISMKHYEIDELLAILSRTFSSVSAIYNRQ